MTDETRSELRRGIDALVRAFSLADAALIVGIDRNAGQRLVTDVIVYHPHEWPVEELAPLTTAQQLALSVLLGEPDAAVTSALCDLLIEQGHEYAVAVAEKARAEERERCVVYLHEQATAHRDYGSTDITAVLRHAALSVAKLHEVTA